MRRSLIALCCLIALAAMATADKWPAGSNVDTQPSPLASIATKYKKNAKHWKSSDDASHNSHDGHHSHSDKDDDDSDDDQDEAHDDEYGYEPKNGYGDYIKGDEYYSSDSSGYDSGSSYEEDGDDDKSSEDDEKNPKHKDPNGDSDKAEASSCRVVHDRIKVTGPVNPTCPTKPNPNGKTCDVPSYCPTAAGCADLGCPDKQYQRFGNAEVEAHFDFQPHYRLVDDRHHTFACTDAHEDGPLLATPGGDLGEVISAALAMLKLCGERYHSGIVDEVFDAFISNVASSKRPLYFHTDESYLRQMFVYLAYKLGGQPSVLPFRGPPGHAGDIWVNALIQSDYQGCGHIRLLTSSKYRNYYSLAVKDAGVKDCSTVPDEDCILSDQVGQRILEDYFRYWWFTKPGSHHRRKVDFRVDLVSNGPLLGKAFTSIKKHPADACTHKAPLVRPNFGGSPVFVHHADAVADFRDYVAYHVLASCIHKHNGTVADFLSLWNKVAAQHLDATLAFLSPLNNVGRYNVSIPVAKVEKKSRREREAEKHHKSHDKSDDSSYDYYKKDDDSSSDDYYKKEDEYSQDYDKKRGGDDYEKKRGEKY